MPEVAGEAAVLIDPRSEGAIAEGLGQVLADEGLAVRLREAGRERVLGFDWDRAARAHAAVLHRAGR
jgi:glycosyltransferase involved in cell wall biosynthesis